MILLVNTETEREWSRADCAAVSEMARIVASGIKNTSLLIEAKQEAEYYRNHDALTGLMRYDRFKESCQMLMDEARKSTYWWPAISKALNSLTRPLVIPGR